VKLALGLLALQELEIRALEHGQYLHYFLAHEFAHFHRSHASIWYELGDRSLLYSNTHILNIVGNRLASLSRPDGCRSGEPLETIRTCKDGVNSLQMDTKKSILRSVRAHQGHGEGLLH
jgi:hypothetical protein